MPVLTRIMDAKFKAMVRPGDTLRIEVKLDEQMGYAFLMTGLVRCGGKLVLRVKFVVALMEP